MSSNMQRLLLALEYNFDFKLVVVGPTVLLIRAVFFRSAQIGVILV